MIKLLILLLISTTQQRCLEGCLRCSEDNKCLYCDVLNGYQLRSERCIKPEIPNCVLTDEKFHCLMCSSEHYLDRTLNKCTELITEIKVPNCEVHEGPKKCQLCQKNYFLKNGACEQIANPISNCRIENERGICLECEPEYIRSVDKKTCLMKPDIQNCGTHKWVSCKSCSPSYLNNDNYYFDILFNFDRQKDPKIVHQQRKNLALRTAEGFKFPVCQKIGIENCEVYDTFNRCKKCVTGYFVNQKKICQRNPIGTIKNCLKYSSETNCITCSQGYHLQDSKCTKVYNIENCMIYKQDAQTTVCTRCFDDFYLSAENLCSKRTDLSNIPLCIRLSYNFEKCEECLNGYVTTSDGFRCLAVIKNCQKYQVSNKNDTFLRCQLCGEGLYYNQQNRICIKGTVPNCMTYEMNSNQCKECKPKYYLVDNKCEPQNQLKFCSVYHKSIRNECVDCDKNSFLFYQLQSCQKVDSIPRCEVYSSNTACAKCRDGYYLKDTSECKQIDLRENCLQKSGSNCIKCLPHFALLQGKCIKSYNWVTSGCQNTNLDGTSTLQGVRCNTCRSNHVPIDAKNTFQCYEIETLHKEFNLNKDQSFDKDCIQYRLNQQGLYECVKCVSNRVLMDGHCRENCYQPGKLTVYKQWISLHNKTGDALQDAVRVDYTNICEKTIPNCAVASLDIDQDFVNIRYSCEQCMKGFIPVIDLPAYGKVSKNSKREKDLNVHMPMTEGPGVICIDPLQETILGDVNHRKKVDFCDYYVRISKNSFGCRTCAHGKTGKIIQAIKRCKVFQNPQFCFECDQGFFLKNQNECRPIVKIDFCQQYDPKHNATKCTRCNDTHYLVNQVCLPREESLGKENCNLKVDDDVCECQEKYVIHPNTKICLKKPDNCLDATVQSENINCLTCDRRYAYLSNNKCLIGTVAYCEEFHLSQNTCTKCLNGHYLENNVCKPHTNGLDDLCGLWSQGTKNVCNKCKPEATKFKNMKHCKSVNEVIPNCKTYSDIFSCKECEQGYYLNNVSKRCLVIPPSTHCLKLRVVDLSDQNVYDKNDYTEKVRYIHTCDQCEVNFYRRQYSINEKYYVDGNLNTQSFNLFHCVDWLNYHTKNCTETEINGVENLSNFCYGCSTSYLPFLASDNYVCVNKNYIIERKHGFTMDPNCRAYRFTDQREMQCMYCKENTYLDEGDNNSCKPEGTACSGVLRPFAFYIDSENKVRKWVCATGDEIVNCSSYVTSFIKNDGTTATTWTKSQSCFKCAANNYPVLIVVAPPIRHLTPINVIDQVLDIKYHDQLFPAVECKTFPVLGVVSGSSIKNCALYKLNAAEDKLLCRRCKQGYHGRVFKDGANADLGIESCEKMTSCASETALSGLHINAPWQDAIVHPISLFSCQKCTDAGKIPVAIVGAVNANAFYGATEIFAIFRINFIKDATATNLMVNDAAATALNNDSQPADSYQLQCWDETKIVATSQPTAEDVLTYSNPGVALPANCGMVMVDATIIENNAFCVACKSGYYINTYDGTNTFAVTECLAVPNCTANADESLNRCSGCVYLYDSNTDQVGVDPTTNCIAPKQGNCFAGVLAGGAVTCHICDPGYELVNNQCLMVNVPNCKAKKSNLFDSYNKTHKVIAERFFQYAWVSQQLDVPGCVECESQDDILYLNSSTDDYMHPAVCTQWMNTNGVFSAGENTNYITNNTHLSSLSNCLRYGYKDNKYICVECNNGYRLHTSDFSCNLITNTMTDLLPNCMIAESDQTTICQKCQTNYVNIGGLCRPIADTNFVDVNCQQTASAQKTNYQSICSKCKPGYYAKITVSPFNKCVPIPATETNCQDYLDETGCVDCAPGYGLMLVRKLNSDQQKRICVKMDQATANKYNHDENCDKLTVVANSESLNQQRLICRKCLQHSVLTTEFIEYHEQCYPVVESVANCVKYDSPNPDADILASQLQLIASKDFKCIECSNEVTFYLDRVANQCVLRTLIPDCDQYDKMADRCMKCSQGFKLNVNMRKCENYKNNTNTGYLDVCRDINGCKATTHYEGLSKTMTSVYTCHHCQESDQIPFAIGTLKLNEKEPGFETLINVNEVTSQFLPWQNTNIDPQQQVQCLKPSNDTFGMASADYTFPQNCALGFINVEPLLDNSQSHNSQHSVTGPTEAQFDYNKTTVRCHACKPGFAPTRPQMTLNGSKKELNFLITECTPIANCENSTWFNGCSQCQAGFANVYENGSTRFDICQEVPEVHKECWSFNQTTQKCIFCKKGTYLNQDDVCELINTPNCENREFSFGQIYTIGTLHQGLYFQPDFVGCNKCKEGYVGLWVPETKAVCVNSLYHVNQSHVENTLFVKNCDEYYLSDKGTLRCKKCAPGQVKSLDERYCFSTSNLDNCEIASSSQVCSECIDEHVNVNGTCVKGSIAGCIRYANSKLDCPLCHKHEQICLQCAPEKYLDGNECIDGTILNCKVQETAKICKECEDNYTLILSKNHTSYCYPNDPRYNCKAFIPEFFQAQVLQCAQCKDSSYVLSNSQTVQSFTNCTQFKITQNCQKYDNNPITLGNSSFKCLECNRDYYMNGDDCVKRSVMPNECTDYELDQDVCRDCQTGYYINVDGKSCVAYPQGISGCESYLSENNCIKCLPGYYEKEDGCEPVVNEIENCVYYEDEDICSQCSEGFYMQQGRCFQVLAQNCLTVDTPFACQTCLENAFLQTVEGITSCVVTPIANCVKISTEEPYDCLRCTGDLYPNKQECTAVPAPIKDCLEYESPNVCRRCQAPAALSVDRNACIKTPESLNHIDLSCQENVMNEKPVCSTCQPGYLFQYGKCIACNTGIGCFVCDPNKLDRCLMCNQGYIMTPEKTCLKPIQESSGLDDNARNLREMNMDNVVLMRL